MVDHDPGSPTSDPCPSNVKDNLQLQLAEVEMLRSMYPSQQEFYMEDSESVAMIQAFVDGDVSYEYLHYRIGFAVCFPIEQGKVEVVCHLPHEYPMDSPDVFTRLPPLLSRESQKSFTDNLHEYINTIPKGDICIGIIIDWIKENVTKYLSESSLKTKSSPTKRENWTFIRLWIYSHHIFSKFKRRDIIDIAQELKLSGFSVPGKPGLICVEGGEDDVDEFWNRIRRMAWKKLAIKDREEVKVASNDELKQCHKFDDFQEKAFDVRGGKGREYHMDLGKVYEFLDGVGCGHVFSYYFGVEGRTSDKLTDT